MKKRKKRKELYTLFLLSDMFYEWQYVFRWGATDLRKSGIMKQSCDCKKGMWKLSLSKVKI